MYQNFRLGKFCPDRHTFFLSTLPFILILQEETYLRMAVFKTLRNSLGNFFIFCILLTENGQSLILCKLIREVPNLKA